MIDATPALVLFTAALIYKAVELTQDIVFWTLRPSRGAAFRAMVEAELRTAGEADITALEATTKRWQPVWQAARSRPWLRPVARLFRTPIIQLPIVVVLLVPVLGKADWAIVLAGVALLASTFILVLDGVVQRLVNGWFDNFKSDLSFDPAISYVLRPADISVEVAFKRVLVGVLTLVFSSLCSFAGIYAGLIHVAPGSMSCNVDQCTSAISPLYFSAVVTSTIGFGDIYPGSATAQLLVFAQVMLGPLFLTLLLLGVSSNLALPSLGSNLQDVGARRPENQCADAPSSCSASAGGAAGITSGDRSGARGLLVGVLLGLGLGVQWRRVAGSGRRRREGGHQG